MSLLKHGPEREQETDAVSPLHSLHPYLRAESFGEILHATQCGAQVNIVAVQEDAQQGMGGTGIGDQLQGNTRLASTEETTLHSHR